MTATETPTNTDPPPVKCANPDCRRTLYPMRDDVYPSPRLDRTYYCQECWLTIVVAPIAKGACS